MSPESELHQSAQVQKSTEHAAPAQDALSQDELDQAVGGASDIVITKVIDKPSPKL